MRRRSAGLAVAAQPTATQVEFQKALEDEGRKADADHKKLEEEWHFHEAWQLCVNYDWQLSHCDLIKRKWDQILADQKRQHDEMEKADKIAAEKTIAIEAAELSKSKSH